MDSRIGPLELVGPWIGYRVLKKKGCTKIVNDKMGLYAFL